jgi:hypothetical protein
MKLIYVNTLVKLSGSLENVYICLWQGLPEQQIF